MRTIAAVAAVVTATALTAAGTLGHDGSVEQTPAIIGPADDWVFPLAEPGSYDLPAISKASNAWLLDETGQPVELSALYDGHVSVLGFIYTRCGDICPIASAQMAQLQAVAAKDPDVAATLRLISLSFDPSYDTPERMAAYGAAFRSDAEDAPDWAFLTAPSEAAIAPVVESYGQPIMRKADPHHPAGPFSHLLRVFLVDGEGVIRNIYSADFLDPRLVLNDVRTLQMETDGEERR